MPIYRAFYTIKSCMYDGGEFMPDPEPHKRDYQFEAKNKTEAKKLAKKHRGVVSREFFGPIVTIDEILEIKDSINKP